MRHRIQVHLGGFVGLHAVKNTLLAIRAPRHDRAIGLLPLPFLEELLHLTLRFLLGEETLHRRGLLAAHHRGIDLDLLGLRCAIGLENRIAVWTDHWLLHRYLLDKGLARFVGGQFNHAASGGKLARTIGIGEVIDQLIHLGLLIHRSVEVAGEHLLAHHSAAGHKRALDRDLAGRRVDRHALVILVPTDELIAVHRISLQGHVGLLSLQSVGHLHRRAAMIVRVGMLGIDVRIHTHIGLVTLAARGDGKINSPQLHRARDDRALAHHLIGVGGVEHEVVSLGRLLLGPPKEHGVLHLKACLRPRAQRGACPLDDVDGRRSVAALHVIGHHELSIAVGLVVRHDHVRLAGLDQRGVNHGVGRVGQRGVARDVGRGVAAVIGIHRVQRGGMLAQLALGHHIRRDGVDGHLGRARGLVVHRVILGLRHEALGNRGLVDPTHEHRTGALRLHLILTRVSLADRRQRIVSLGIALRRTD